MSSHSDRRSARVGIRARVLFTAVAASIGLLGSNVVGQVDGSWIAADGSWSNPGNWANGIKPGGGGTAYFGLDAAAAISASNYAPFADVLLDEAVTLSRLVFTSPAFSQSVFSPSGGAPITLVGPAEIYTSTRSPSSGGRLWLNQSVYIGNLTGSSGLTKTGPGILWSDENSFTGDVVVREGLFVAGNDAAFGNTANKVVLDGGGLTLNSNTGTQYHMRVTEVAARGGSFRPFGQMTVEGDVIGTGTLTIGPQSPEYPNDRVVFSGAKSFGGVLRLERGAVVLGQNSSLLNAAALELNNGTFQLDNIGPFSANRIGDDTSVKIRSAEFRLTGNTSVPSIEQIGKVTVSGGAKILGDVRAPLRMAALAREDRGTAVIDTTGVVIGAESTVFALSTTAPQLIGGGGAAGSHNIRIIPFAISPSVESFVTWDATTKELRRLDNSEYSTIAAAAPDDNVSIDSSQSIAAAQTVNALRVRAATVSGGGTISITSGALFARGATIANPLSFPNGEAILSGSNSTISGPIFATDGLTAAGSVTLSGISTYTGTTTVHGSLRVEGSNVAAGIAGPLGIDASPIVLSPRASLSINGGSFNRDVVSNDLGSFNVSVGAGAVMNGAIHVDGVLALGSGTFNGPISGAAQLQIADNAVTLRGNSTFTGGVNLYSGSLSIGSSSALGSGVVLVNEGYLGAVDAPATIANAIKTFDRIKFSAGPMLTITGPVEMGLDNIIVMSPGANATLAGSVVAAGISVRSDTSGGPSALLRLAGDNRAFGGTLTINENMIVEVAHPNALGSRQGPTVVSPSGLLRFPQTPAGLTIVGEPLQLNGSDVPSFENAGGHNAWLGPVTYSGGTIKVSGDTLTIYDPATGSTGNSTAEVIKTGPGVLILKKPIFNEIDINQGVVRLQPNGTDAGAGKIRLLYPKNNAALDLSDNDLLLGGIIHSGGGPTFVRDALRTGYADGAWNGPGINSSAAANNPVGNTTLGMLTPEEYIANNGSSTFAGFSLGDFYEALIKYTYYGDVDFNGQLDASDYNLIDFGFVNHLTGWANGDVDFSGAVDVSDYNLIDFAFVTQNGVLRRAVAYLDGTDRSTAGMSDPSLQEVAAHLGAFGEPYRSAFLAQVPEPGTVLLAALGVGVLQARRRGRGTKYC